MTYHDISASRQVAGRADPGLLNGAPSRLCTTLSYFAMECGVWVGICWWGLSRRHAGVYNVWVTSAGFLRLGMRILMEYQPYTVVRE